MKEVCFGRFWPAVEVIEAYTAKSVPIRTLKIFTLFEHLKVFCLHTPSVLDFHTI